MERNRGFRALPRPVQQALTKYRYLTLPLVSLVVFWPALDNGFISDDFIFLDRVESWARDPFYLFTIPPENFRSTTYLSFLVLKAFFGYQAAPFYLFTIFLHGCNALLLGRLVGRLSGEPLTGGVTSLLFVAFQNPQEAVMWLGGMHECLLGFFTLSALNLWWSENFLGSGLAFCLTLFTKESGVVTLPLVLLVDRWKEGRFRIRRQILYLVAPTVLFGFLFLALASGNSLVRGGFYALHPRAVLVLVRSLHSLAFTWLYLALLLVIWWKRRFPVNRLAWGFAWMVTGLTPYIFLTYQDHVPSRHEYLAGMGTAAAIAFCLRQVDRRQIVPIFLGFFLVVNAGYIVLRKDAQFEERAAPTSRLISQLQKLEPQRILIRNFPLNPWIARMTAPAVPGWKPELIVLEPDACPGCPELRWDPETQAYTEIKTR